MKPFAMARLFNGPVGTTIFVVLVTAACSRAPSRAQSAPQTIRSTIATLRSLPDDKRAAVTRDLASQIGRLPARPDRLPLALSLANLSTEGDFGRDALQQVTTTLALAVRESPPASAAENATAEGAYQALAQLARYEQMSVDLDVPRYQAAVVDLERLDAVRAAADFTLTDLDGRTWTRSALTGRVVLVNFWATWCPPCRKEMPDLDALSREFQTQGLVVLAISDEPVATIRTFLAQHAVNYPILLDTGRSVSDALKIDSIPKTFIYDRSGRLVAQSIDMRTRSQFLALLAKADIR